MELSERIKEALGMNTTPSMPESMKVGNFSLTPNAYKAMGFAEDFLSSSSFAKETSKAQYGDKKDQYSGWGDKEDAARHLLWVGEMARTTNPTVAKTMGYLYETVFGAASQADQDMDIHNNELALKLFNAKSRDELKARVDELMKGATKGATGNSPKVIRDSGEAPMLGGTNETE